jgi:hypothetical protein
VNTFAVIFFIVNAGMLLLLPRRWAPLPLLMGTCYMTMAQGIQLGPFHFPLLRMLVVAGVLRIIVKRERIAGGMNSLDWLIIAFGTWALISSIFHKDISAAMVFRLGLAYNVCGIYFLLRIFCQSIDDVVHLSRLVAILLLPVALEMVYEVVVVQNLFSTLGGVGEAPAIRMGRVRANGPFSHAILAGSVGAVCIPLMIGLWQKHKKTGMVGLIACLTMVFTCASSGPILTVLVGILALAMWPLRERMRIVRWLAVLGYIALDIVMKAPAYYLLARIDVASGSTGWHRAALIESAIKYIGEWWLGGTDYTRHWMPYGVSWSEDHADITNHYIQMGVIGGLPLTMLLITIFYIGFSLVGEALRQSTGLSKESRFYLWALGATLFAHAATCISVCYFDQSFIFLYLTFAAIGSACAPALKTRVTQRRRKSFFNQRRLRRRLDSELTEDTISDETISQQIKNKSTGRTKNWLRKKRQAFK